MKLGLSPNACAWAIGVPGQPPAHSMDIFGLLAEAERLGTRVLPACDNLPLTRLTPAERNEFERRAKAACMAGIEMGEPHYPVDNPDRWMKETLKYLAKHLSELTQ